MTVPRKYRKLFQDSIVVEIPLSEPTADLGVILKRARAKRIQALYEHFPSLKKDAVANPSPADNVTEAHDDDDSNKEQEEPISKKTKVVDETLPQRQQYGSIVDYLEAKYVRGVMLGDKIDESESSDKDSVYSEDSWLDDSLLKRDVAEQVLSHSTQTKVGVDDEDDFFVNVGNLEVEDNDLMDYDPVEDEKAAQKAKKRKRSSSAASTKSGKSGKNSTKSTPKKSSDSMPVSSKKKDTPTSSDGAKNVMSEDTEVLKQKATELEATVKDLYDRLVSDIKAMSKDDLPQRNKNVQVTLTVMEGKAPGDTITFANPHVPNQRLKVKIPKGKEPGSLFKVSIPAPQVDEETDGNKFTREFQELAAHYATTYDLWCHAEAECHQADPNLKGKYPLKAKMIAKFDEMVKAFPSTLLTPIDAAYMKKVVRRARQNKKKRKEATDDTVATAIVAAMASKPAAKPDAKPSPKSKPAMKVDVKSMPKAPKHKLMKAIKPVKQPEPEVFKTIEIILPSKGRMFPQKELRHNEFESMTS